MSKSLFLKMLKAAAFLASSVNDNLSNFATWVTNSYKFTQNQIKMHSNKFLFIFFNLHGFGTHKVQLGQNFFNLFGKS